MLHIGVCSFSFHSKPFYSSYKFGLQDYLFRLQTEGTCQIVINGKAIDAEKGDLILLKPGDDYELKIEEGQNSGDFYVFCNGPWLDEWWKRSKKPSISRIHLDEKILSLWRQIIIEERRPSTAENKELKNYLMMALCLYLERAANETNTSLDRPPIVTRMMRFIEEQALTSFKIQEVAEHVELSVSRAVHLFKEYVGKTMIEYAQEIRLAAAKDQMKYTSMPLDQIAENCGFGSYTYFHKVFKMKYGKAPGALRREE
ncbi:AraC family transcriptional regulator [Halalkalibacter flavus]|uniref:AraC family transcriptional regulator n=1 Tax=Halalkalibacter flavus TaxID=3090668 RepID=UPI002FCBBF9A